MRDRLINLLNEYRHRRQLRRWDMGGEKARDMPLSELRELRRKAQQIRRRVDAINHVAVSRLTPARHRIKCDSQTAQNGMVPSPAGLGRSGLSQRNRSGGQQAESRE